MTNPLILKLQTLARLSDGDRQALELALDPSRVVASGESIVADGANPDGCNILIDGMACRHKSLSSRERQILGLHIAGDILDLHGLIVGPMDYGVGAVTSCRVATIRHDVLLPLMAERPQIALALWRHTLVDSAIARRWLVNLGHSRSRKRIAQLFCELAARLSAVGLGRGNRYRLPLTQAAIADATGMSDVQVNRILQQLRAEELVAFEAGVLLVRDVAALQALADFDPSYLQVGLRPDEKSLSERPPP